MLNSINISHIFVFDQDKALDFYVGKLGPAVTPPGVSTPSRSRLARVESFPPR